jgi:hypothetical protein
MIKNLNLIKNLLSKEKLQKLEAHAQVFDQSSKINFEIIEVVDNEISILVTQGNAKPEYLTSQKELEKRGKSFFEFYLPDHVIQINSNGRGPTPVEIVNPDWIQKQLKNKGITLHKIAMETGIEKKRLSNWLSGTQTMSATVKAMFWYMLR